MLSEINYKLIENDDAKVMNKILDFFKTTNYEELDDYIETHCRKNGIDVIGKEAGTALAKL